MCKRYFLLVIIVKFMAYQTIYSQTISGTTGTYSNINGNYTVSSTNSPNSKPSWKHNSQSFYVHFATSPSSAWVIDDDLTDNNGQVYFFNTDISGGNFPPTSGWSNGIATGTITLSGFDANSLPVELTSFTALVSGNNVNLNWKTATEVNNYGFNVERSNVKGQTSNWQKVGFVQGHGNSNSPKSYTFTDQPTGGTSFSYRLKQIDNDGGFKYYDAITVSLTSSAKAELMQNSPNPFNPSTSIKYYIPNNSDVSIKIYDMLGKEVTTLINNQSEAGYHIVYWNGMDRYGNQAASGVYLYRLTAGNFSETRKMQLLK